ncbi:MAG: dihydrolipoamide acetyltransferase family protein, partial [Actinomycetota bacterium]
SAGATENRSAGATMGRLTVKVPDVGEGVAEVELVSWAVTPGQPVERNQIIAEVMTDKATVEVPSPVDGVVDALSGDAGDRLLVGEPLFVLAVDGEGDTEVDADPDGGAEAAAPASAAPPAAGAAPPAAATAPTSTPEPTTTAPSVAAAAPAPTPAGGPRPITGWSPAAPRAEHERPRAAPSVRRRAREAGVDLRTVAGTGPAGRITNDDLDQVFRQPSGGRSGGPDRRRGGGSRPADPTVTDQPVIGLRRRIAEQMVASTSTIPHITYVDEVDMTALEELRTSLNDRAASAGGTRLTILPFLVRALVQVLPEFPQCNAHLLDGTDGPDTLRTFGGVHVGIATQTGNGLVVPVLRHAESESLWSSAARLAELADSARTGRASAADLSGSTITITSLGALGGLVTTPVINKPETTIVGVNKLAVRPVWDGERFVPRSMMNLSSSFDHRVVDGWDAANFVRAVKALLEQPALLFVGPEEI